MSAHRDDDFTAYVQARLPWLRRVAYLLCQDWQRADDLVQTAITSLYVHRRRARTMENIDGYARTILVRSTGRPSTCWASSCRPASSDSFS